MEHESTHSISQVLRRLRERLTQLLANPESILQSSAMGLEIALQMKIGELCGIEGKANDWYAMRCYFDGPSRLTTGKVGSSLFGDVNEDRPQIMPEVASVYAEIAGKLGQISLYNLLPKDEYLQTRQSLKEYCGQARSEHDVRLLLGTPSWKVQGTVTTVLCYGTADAQDRWLYFDFHGDVLRNARTDVGYSRFNINWTPEFRPQWL